MGNIIETHKLTKYYGKQRGVTGLDFSVKQGEIFGFLGPNGAGKTTTMRLLLHLLKPSSGSATVLGKSIGGSDYPSYLKDVGYLPGDLELYRKMTGRQMLNFASRFYAKDYLKTFHQELIEWLDCQMDKPYGKLSRGNKQKIGIFLALFHNPRLLVLDEPTNGLDPITQNKFYQLLKQLNQGGTTILFSSHNLPEVEKVCDRVGIIKEGALIKVETLEDLKRQHVKIVNVFFAGPYQIADFQILPGVKIVEYSTDHLLLNVANESITPLLAVLARHQIKDLNFSSPVLEEMFLTYY